MQGRQVITYRWEDCLALMNPALSIFPRLIQASGARFSPGMGVYLVDKYSQTITAGADAAAKIEVTLVSLLMHHL